MFKYKCNMNIKGISSWKRNGVHLHVQYMRYVAVHIV